MMNAFFNQFPRDSEFKAEQWTTVDPGRNNQRVRACQTLLPGLSMFLLLMGKNQFDIPEVEERSWHLALVSNIAESSGPPDLDGAKSMMQGKNAAGEPKYKENGQVSAVLLNV